MINLDPRYRNYWIDQAREEQKERDKESRKSKLTQQEIGEVLDILDHHIKAGTMPIKAVPTAQPLGRAFKKKKRKKTP